MVGFKSLKVHHFELILCFMLLLQDISPQLLLPDTTPWCHHQGSRLSEPKAQINLEVALVLAYYHSNREVIIQADFFPQTHMKTVSMQVSIQTFYQHMLLFSFQSETGLLIHHPSRLATLFCTHIANL